MQPFFSEISLAKTSELPVYLQLASIITGFIKDGYLKAGDQLPSTRNLAKNLKVHRKTVVRTYEDLILQGWLESYSGSGTFVSNHFPETLAQKLKKQQKNINQPVQQAGFTFPNPPHLDRETSQSGAAYHLDDGFPDPRIAPLADLSRAHRTQLLTGNSYARLGYQDTQGSIWLREELSKHLNSTRGMKTTAENILITRGAVMGLYLACTGLIERGNKVISGAPGWLTTEAIFTQAGASVLRIPVDEYGIKVDELEEICKKTTIRMVYVTPHHHYPSTVILRADRRLQLLRLAEKYGFIIFEDDYDYDFHFQNKPISPLASIDQNGMVLYCGSFTKAISPAFRVGYLAGPVDVIKHLSKLRRIIDRQGDIMLENALAELLQGGVIQRHLRKSVRLYRQRRDVFCELLQSKLSNYVQFIKPEGGMAVWTNFEAGIDMAELSVSARKKDLYFSDGLHHATLGMANFTRLGFASSTFEELEIAVELLMNLVKKH
jgi:GntR family transcriptional regulator/MocR family aminotransferase